MSLALWGVEVACVGVCVCVCVFVYTSVRVGVFGGVGRGVGRWARGQAQLSVFASLPSTVSTQCLLAWLTH